MSLFKRQKSSDIPAELQPYYDPPAAPTRNWVRWIVRAVVLLILLAAVVFGGIWGWHQIQKNDTKAGQLKPAQSQQSQKSTADNKKSPTSTTQKSDSNTNTTSTTTKPATNAPAATAPTTPDTSAQAQANSGSDSTATTSTSSSDNQTQTTTPSASTLVNTGPGSTIALFAAAVVIGSILNELRIRRVTN